ncbi:MAG: ribonucleoside-diphosphate reductase subunit alpha [Alphaproteobacteria bacterium]|nr:ribonucleoside-diphosphate reductase subunit alpha [Alphaproteobacteria bacterium]
MTEIQIIKRDSTHQSYDFSKIQKTLDRAIKGFDLNQAPLIEKINQFIKNETTTKEIINYLTLTALSLTSIDEPDWKNAAGRLKLFELYKQTAINRGLNHSEKSLYHDFCGFVKNTVKCGVYSSVLTEKYTDEELQEAGKFINPDFDLLYDYAGINLLIKRYLCEYNDKIVELPQEMFLTIALLIEQNAPKNIRLALVKDTYEKLADRKISLGTPLLMNLRRPNGNLSSCFITVMDDNRDSIFYVIDQISAISKFGGGVGCNLSRVRCKGARIKGIKNSSGGVIPWIRIINDTAVAVNQQGKRKGAVTVSLDIWHLDIEDFLELRTENGDQRMKAYDIFPQVVIPDLFMKKVENNEKWLLVDPNEVRTKYGKEIANLWGKDFEELYAQLYLDAEFGKLEMFKFVSAKELLKRLMKSQIETGMPYIAFKDTLNRYNPNKHDGIIVGTNLCTESHSNVRPTEFLPKRLDGNKIISETQNGLVHVCNLVSINLANIDSDEELDSICQTSVRILDNAIDFTEVPILEGSQHNQRYRTIGIGAMGLADHLAKRNIPYIASADYVDDLFEKIAIYNIRASINAAKEKGTFGAYKGSDWDKGLILGKRQLEFQGSKYKEEWNKIFSDLAKHGIRNSQLSAIAPNTSSSLIQGCTASVLPIYSKFFVETHGKGSIPNCPPFIKDKFWFYQENRNINQKTIIDIMSRINKWIDTGISIELMYNLNRNIKAVDIYETIMDAWKKDIKTLYYTRTIQKDGSSVEKSECVSCAG